MYFPKLNPTQVIDCGEKFLGRRRSRLYKGLNISMPGGSCTEVSQIPVYIDRDPTECPSLRPTYGQCCLRECTTTGSIRYRPYQGSWKAANWRCPGYIWDFFDSTGSQIARSPNLITVPHTRHRRCFGEDHRFWRSISTRITKQDTYSIDISSP